MPYEQLAGFTAAVDYWASVDAAGAGHAHARELGRALPRRPARRRAADRPADDGRPRPDVPARFPDRDAAERLRRTGRPRLQRHRQRHFYCLGLEDDRPGKALRVGLFHYNTADEVDALLAALADAL